MKDNEVKNSYEIRQLNPFRLNAILDFAGESVLDVGCGNGSYVLELKDKYDIKGVDFQDFSAWRESPELFSISDASQLCLKDSSVDTILSFETLEHLYKPEEALREYHRVCRKNLILTVPNCVVSDGMKSSNLIFSHCIHLHHGT